LPGERSVSEKAMETTEERGNERRKEAANSSECLQTWSGPA
jgi:hypothetical protein